MAQEQLPAFDPSTYKPFVQNTTSDDTGTVKSIQNGFDQLTAPESYGTKHTGNPIADAGITTLSNLGAGTIGLASPLIHPIKTLQGINDLGAAALGNKRAQAAVTAPWVSHGESWGDYGKRIGGQLTTLIPSLASMAPETGVGDLAADAVGATTRAVGKYGPHIATPALAVGAAVAGHPFGLIPELASAGAGLYYGSKAGNMLSKIPFAERMSTVGQLTPFQEGMGMMRNVKGSESLFPGIPALKSDVDFPTYQNSLSDVEKEAIPTEFKNQMDKKNNINNDINLTPSQKTSMLKHIDNVTKNPIIDYNRLKTLGRTIDSFSRPGAGLATLNQLSNSSHPSQEPALPDFDPSTYKPFSETK